MAETYSRGKNPMAVLSPLDDSTTLFFEGAEHYCLPRHDFRNPLFITMALLACAHVVMLNVYLWAPRVDVGPLERAAPATYTFVRSALPTERLAFSEDEYLAVTARAREFLPEGRCWLDQRSPPVYPLVHADPEVCCAYNPGLCGNGGARSDAGGAGSGQVEVFPTPEAAHALAGDPGGDSPDSPDSPVAPDVVFLIFESFTPAMIGTNPDFIREDPGAWTDIPYFSPETLPNLMALAKTGVVFSGLGSLGIPTISGWHALMSGITPSLTNIRMSESQRVEADDLPSSIRALGYHSMYVSPSPLEFDGKENWVFRKPAEEEAAEVLGCALEGRDPAPGYDPAQDPIQEAYDASRGPLPACDLEEVLKKARRLRGFPRWFDYVSSYYPTPEQTALLGLDPESVVPANWIADRITTRQFQYHFVQEKRKAGDTPLFAMYMNVDTHTPFEGFDVDEFYDQSISEVEGATQAKTREKYARVFRYADKHFIGETIDFLRSENPNTIVVLCGDHGAREVPVYEADEEITPGVRFDPRCAHQSFGVDSFFTTGALISYLGEDPRVLRELEAVRGKTFTFPADTEDLVWTLRSLLSRVLAKPLPPSARVGRDLLREAGALLRGEEPTPGWKSVSVIPLSLEYREPRLVFRTHTLARGDADGYLLEGSEASYPTCLLRDGNLGAGPGGDRTISGVRRDALRLVKYRNYLATANRLYNQAFRDTSCVAAGTCTFPEPETHNESVMIGLGLFGICSAVAILFAGILNLVFCLVNRRMVRRAKEVMA